MQHTKAGLCSSELARRRSRRLGNCVLAAALSLASPVQAAAVGIFDAHVHLWNGDESLRTYQEQLKRDNLEASGIGVMWFGGPVRRQHLFRYLGNCDHCRRLANPAVVCVDAAQCRHRPRTVRVGLPAVLARAESHRAPPAWPQRKRDGSNYGGKRAAALPAGGSGPLGPALHDGAEAPHDRRDCWRTCRSVAPPGHGALGRRPNDYGYSSGFAAALAWRIS